MGFKIFEKKKIRIYRSILTLDRSPERLTWIGSLAKMPVTFYSKTREGKTASVGGCERTKYWSSQICKRNKKVLIIKWLKSILLSIQLMQQRGRIIKKNNIRTSFIVYFNSFLTQISSRIFNTCHLGFPYRIETITSTVYFRSFTFAVLL
jgi:hypothetical protein